MQTFLIIAAAVLIVAIAVKIIVFPPVRKIPVTGKHEITSTDYWVGEDRPDPYRSDGKQRELQIRKWSPAKSESDLPAGVASRESSGASDETEDDLPVIIASHGSCGTIDNNVSLYRELASHGYTVLAVCHPGQAVKVKYSDGKNAGPSRAFLKQMSSLKPQEAPENAYELFREWMEIRVADLNAVLDDYKEREGETKFLSLGHSLGGSAAYAMARVREDVVGCIALESPCMYDIKGVEDGAFVFDDSDYRVPLLNIYSDSAWPHLREWSQYKNNAMFLEKENPAYTNIHYEGTSHMGLCDLAIVSPVLSAALSGGFQRVNAYKQLEKLNADCLKWIRALN